MFQLGLKMNLNLRKQSGSTVGKTVVEFHARNTCPVMGQVFSNKHFDIINAVCEESRIGCCTQRDKAAPSSQGCKAPKRSG